ncbi:hypothetical protein FF38_07746 [Lucilia cuprina]|uniref:Uncharacterized protein n=1 Tax=Lucilia cuprina TaxID=7375 RepID=A0A0L0CDZ4_LUCCU|nr:hypothetical protein FF38_07746 [Lucilia cuprina]
MEGASSLTGRRPDQVHNCTLANISMTSLTVTCTDGFNGGLPQLFILELVDTQTNVSILVLI